MRSVVLHLGGFVPPQGAQPRCPALRAVPSLPLQCPVPTQLRCGPVGEGSSTTQVMSLGYFLESSRCLVALVKVFLAEQE